MVPVTSPLPIASHVFQIQRGRELVLRQFKPSPFSNRSDSSTNSTIGDPISTQPHLSVAVAIPAIMLLFIVCVGVAVLGCAVASRKNKLVNQPDQVVKERARQILAQMAAPVIGKTLDLDRAISNCAGASQDDPEDGKAPEIGKTLGHRSRLSVPGNIEEQTDYNCPICLEAMLPRQMIRQMPHCTHIFHQQCCEDWIWKTLKCWRYIRISMPMVCPVCRSNLESQLEAVIKKPDPVAPTTRTSLP